MTITFNLRESKWYDGSPLTAHDFVYSWKRGMDPATASEYAWIWEYTNTVGANEAVNGGSLPIMDKAFDVGHVLLDNSNIRFAWSMERVYVNYSSSL